MTGSPAAAPAAPPRTCDCCNETVRVVDKDGLCFNCVMVRSFAIIIEEQTDIAGDPAVDLACDLVACARRHILEARDNADERDFFADVGSGMVRSSTSH